MLKPDATAKNLAPEIKRRITNAGYKIIRERTFKMSEELVREHYDFLVDKPFFPEILNFMTSGEVMGMIIEGENVITGIRDMIGVTDPALAADGTIRKDFGTDKMRNVLHASDSPETAQIEIKRFFNN
jgi:nucleoside-diphosphate kinase